MDAKRRPRCDGVYDQPVLDHVMRWKDEVLLRWTALLLNDDAPPPNNDVEGRGGGGNGSGGGGGGAPVDGSSAAYGWKQRLGLAVHEAFCSARIAELFDIIADYPDSAVAIGELKVCVCVCAP